MARQGRSSRVGSRALTLGSSWLESSVDELQIMCRLTLYLGPAISLSSLLFEPDHSLIRQSTHSSEREEPLNGDGFGVGWYAHELHAEPAVFRSITPAWNNRNLASLSKVVTSSCVLAHVRAATNLSGVNEANCHPFRFERYLFMHNGDVGGFRGVRRHLLETVSDEAFGNVYGSTDSEHIFALVVDELQRLAIGDPATRLATALHRAIERVVKLAEEYGGGEEGFLNLVLTDGRVAAVSRFAYNTDEEPESLYMYRGHYPLEDHGSGPAAYSALVVASERLSGDERWKAIPANHIAILEPGCDFKLIPIDSNQSASRAA